MPIVTLQRSLREIGRIRMGEKNGNRPVKLDRFRFTSNDKPVIEAAAELYGGTPRRWDGAPIGEQWEVISEATRLEVIVPPGPAALSQWYETWSAGGCTRRCDGATEVLTDTPCLCDTEIGEGKERACQATTRLSLILADLPGLGVWRLETHSYYGATELAGTVDVIRQAAGQGRLLPATLGMSPRQVKRIVKGKAQTMNFVVPTLDIPLTPGALGVGTGVPSASWQAIAAPTSEPHAITAGEMATAMEHPGSEPPKPRANSAPPIPATGIKPRPAVAGSAITEHVEAASAAHAADLKLVETVGDTGLPPGVADIEHRPTPGQAAVIKILNDIANPDARLAAKRDFVTKFGEPHLLTGKTIAAASEWAAARCAETIQQAHAEQPELLP